jgi:basic amino acid/polyamine antiporter, APA family
MERVLGTPALFATAYGNVGSSIYYALGLTAVFALGLTPLVFLVAGIVFWATAATYADRTVRYPEAGGSSSFAPRVQTSSSASAPRGRRCSSTSSPSRPRLFVPHYLDLLGAP